MALLYFRDLLYVFTKLSLVRPKAWEMGHSVKIEITDNDRLAELTNY